MISRAISITLFVYFLLASALAAPVGAIKGYIKDPSGGAVVNADLVLTDEKTGVQTKTASDSNGLYQFLNLNPSVYTVVTQADGFSRTETAHITVLVGQIVSADLNLSVAAVSQSVEVSAGSEVLQTEKASTEQTLRTSWWATYHLSTGALTTWRF